MTLFTGSCSCGHTSFSGASPPFTTGRCYCTSCRVSHTPRVPFLTFSEFPSRDTLFSPPLRTNRTSDKASRGYCAECQEPMTMHYHSTPDTVWIITDLVTQKDWAATLKLDYHAHLIEKDPSYVVQEDGVDKWMRSRGGARWTEGGGAAS